MDRFARLPTADVLGIEVPVAVTRRARLLGLACLDRAAAPEGLLIPGCRGVHTLGMRFPLDLAFLDRRWRPLEVRRGVPPLRFAHRPSAASVLEIPSPRR